MFNRHIYQRYEQLLEAQNKKQQEHSTFMAQRKKNMTQRTQHYKARVRDFLVHMASKPIQLGQYIAPITNIVRDVDQSKNLANPCLYINGFKTNKERLQRAISDQQILDYTPTPDNAFNHQYRPRLTQKEIQPGMRFQGQNSPKSGKGDTTRSRSLVKLPSINQHNPEVKMHFKGVQEMGNKLKSMKQREADRIGLVNKLQTVYGGGDINLESTSLDVLKACKLNKSKTVKTLKTIKTIKSQSLTRTLKTDLQN